MADTLYGLPINSLTSKKPESSDKFISYDDNEKQAHVTTAGELAETMNENLSDAFSSSKSYSAGDYCIYNDTLYKFTADHSGAWDNDDVEAVTVGDELNELNTNLLQVKSFSVDNLTIAAASNTNYANMVEGTIDVSLDGYTPLGIVGVTVTNASSNGINSTSCHPKNFYISGNTLTYRVANTCGGQAVVKFTGYVLYIKNL